MNLKKSKINTKNTKKNEKLNQPKASTKQIFSNDKQKID